MALTIKTANDSDGAVVASIIGRSFLKQAAALSIGRTDYPNYVAFETESGVRSRIASGAHVALAYQGEEVIGTVSCLFRGGEAGEIMRLAVLPPHRGNHYGRELMTHAEDQLTAAGAIVAKVSIVAQFRRLQSYYEDLGYSTGDLTRVPSLPFELLIMEKELVPRVGG